MVVAPTCSSRTMRTKSPKARGASGKPPAHVWMHNGFVRVDNEKMSKSLGNFFTIREVLEKFHPETVRLFLVRTHYRSPLNYSDTHLQDAQAALKRLYTALAAVTAPELPPAIDWAGPYAASFKAAMDNDMGTPEAIAVLFDLASEVNRSQSPQLAGLLQALGGVLGLLQGNPRDFMQSGVRVDPQQIQMLIDERAQAKAQRNFARADAIRQDLLAQGIVLKDSALGTTWEAAS